MSTVSIPPANFTWPVQFRKPVNIFSDGTSTDTVRITGSPVDPLKQHIQVFDGFGNPMEVIHSAGGEATLGDRKAAFRPGDIFNPDWMTLTSTADNVATNAAAFILGHGTAQGAVFSIGVGVPGSAFPITTGVPAMGIYWNVTGAAGSRLYIVSGGAWTAIAGV